MMSELWGLRDYKISISLKISMKNLLIYMAVLFFAFGCQGSSGDKKEVKYRSVLAINVDCGDPTTVQTAIDNASDRDILSCTAGGTWASGVRIPNTKGITLDGNGHTITRGASSDILISISNHATTGTRITGFTFSQTTPNTIISVGGGFANAKFRIDNSAFTTTAASAILIKVTTAWGLIDGCTFTGDSASEMIHNQGWGAVSDAGWLENVVPGSGDALYIEDCTFSKYNQADAYFWGTSGIQSYYGARTVIRYNTFNYCQIDQHGTPGMIGARWWEIYNNTFNIPVGTGPRNQSEFMAIRAGSGVIFNNTKTGGANVGAGSVELFEEDAGYPALYQIGRGTNQALDPAYCWNNMTDCESGSANVVAGRDFYLAQKPSYTAYACPHPLAGLTGSCDSETAGIGGYNN
jgi:hypothetical protein